MSDTETISLSERIKNLRRKTMLASNIAKEAEAGYIRKHNNLAERFNNKFLELTAQILDIYSILKSKDVDEVVTNLKDQTFSVSLSNRHHDFELVMSRDKPVVHEDDATLDDSHWYKIRVTDSSKNTKHLRFYSKKAEDMSSKVLATEIFTLENNLKVIAGVQQGLGIILDEIDDRTTAELNDITRAADGIIDVSSVTVDATELEKSLAISHYQG